MNFNVIDLLYNDKGVINRDIYINNVVDMQTATYVVHAIRKINEYDRLFDEDREKLNAIEGIKFEKTEVEPINLHICSYGGEVHAGLQIMNAIMTSNANVHAYVTTAISMAFCITTVCDLRVGYPMTMCLHHDSSYGAMGNVQDHKERYVDAEKQRDMVDKIIMERTNMSKELMTKIIERKLDYRMYIDELVELGVIDEVLDYNEPYHLAIKKDITKTYQLQTNEGIIETEYTYNQTMKQEEIDEGFRAKVLEVHGYDLNTETFVETEEIEIDTTNMTEREIMLFDETEEDLEDLIMELAEKEPMLLELLEECETKQDLIDLIVSNDIN